MLYIIWLAIIQLYSFDKKSMTKSHALGIRITCIMLMLEELNVLAQGRDACGSSLGAQC